MNVDPVFESLWEATVSELGTEPGIWEIYWDSRNFHVGSPIEAVADAENVLRRLHVEGWADFIRRPWSATSSSAGGPLSGSEVETLIESRAWRTEPPLPNGELPDELNVARAEREVARVGARVEVATRSRSGTFLNARACGDRLAGTSANNTTNAMPIPDRWPRRATAPSSLKTSDHSR
jgi:hypothetical protein